MGKLGRKHRNKSTNLDAVFPKFREEECHIIDIRRELSEFSWKNATWSDDKLIAASPFRYDRSPSFYVWLRDNPDSNAKAGYWADSGAYDAEFARGGIVKLLAFLRNETEGETAEYLEEKYGAAPVTTDDDRWQLRTPLLAKRRDRKASLPESVLPDAPSTTHRYLESRGISEATQRRLDVRFAGNAVAFAWRWPNGALANVKYRTVRGKTFWYAKGGVPIRELIYGIDLIYRERPSVCVICEAEIDAMSVMEASYMAVACGGVGVGQAKVEALLRAPVEEYVILADNDKAGEKLRGQLASALRGQKRVSHAWVDARWKDANEALVSGGAESVRQAIDVRQLTYALSRRRA